jgi:hypothetical protein
VNPAELAFGAVVVPVLLGLAAYFGWRQRRTLLSLRANPDLPPEERGYLRVQAWRRLACCALMVVLAGLLVGSYFFEAPLQEVGEAIRERSAQGQDPEPEHKTFARAFAGYLIAILLVLLTMLILVVMDVFAIARFGARQHRKLREDYRAALQSEITRLRGERNGHK